MPFLGSSGEFSPVVVVLNQWYNFFFFFFIWGGGGECLRADLAKPFALAAHKTDLSPVNECFF